MQRRDFYSNGKLLLTSEYLVLDGAKAIALPTTYGQNLKIDSNTQNEMSWESYDHNNSIWFQGKFDLPKLEQQHSNETAIRLQKILKEAQKLNPDFLKEQNGYNVKTRLTFDNNWGLGSSSTLINNIALWAKVDAFKLLKNSFGGSGYDIACAQRNHPILYQLIDESASVEPADFNPDFIDQLYFVHLNKKQDSREGINMYRNFQGDINSLVKEISQITLDMLNCTTIVDFNRLIVRHEKIIASIIDLKPVQEELFSDYFGQTKSLGAWGGDFILATGNKDTPKYFKNKGFETVISYQNMIL